MVSLCRSGGESRFGEMSLYFLLLIAFLFPLSTYLLILGLVNRRRSPLMVPGTWDFVGVLFGASGFILAGGWFLFYIIGNQSRSLTIFHFHGGDGVPEQLIVMWVLLVAYFLFIV